VSAPITRREVKTELSDTTGVNNRGNAKDRAVTARGRLADANPNGGSAPLFQRTEEIQAVVSLLQESKVVRILHLAAYSTAATADFFGAVRINSGP